jgi:2-polyprenyl-3-methyl-5-hydroxy-6-metoxy-1,4-benzoquinol methylase
MAGMREFYEDYWQYRVDTDYLYEDATPIRIQNTVDILNRLDPDSILDVACGEGTLGKLVNKQTSIVGCDISSKALKIADKHYQETAQIDIETDALSGVFSEEPFDVVVCLEALEHLFNPGAALDKFYASLESGGTLITSFPNYVHYRHRIEMLKGEIPEDTLFADPEHLQEFNLKRFKDLLQEHNFRPNSIHPTIGRPPYIPYRVAERYPTLFATQIVVKSTKES